MAFEIKFPETGNIVEFRASGVLTFDSFSRMHQGLYFSPEWRTGMNCLGIMDKGADISAITPDVLNTEFREELERVRRLRGPDFKMAWVVENEHHLPMFRLWGAMPFNNRNEMRIFRRPDDARDWLNLFNRAQNAA